MGQTKNDSDYKRLPDGPKNGSKEAVKDGSKNGDKEEDKENEDKGPPWVWFGGVVIAFGLTTGLCPAVALWIQTFASAGICTHLCDGEEQCSQSSLMVANFFSMGSYTMQLAAWPSGVFFDKAGGKTAAVLGCMITAGSWWLMTIPVIGAGNGSDGVTWLIFLAAVLINNIGFKLMCAGVACAIWWFHAYVSIIFTMFNTSLVLSSLIPMAVLPLVTAKQISLVTVLVGFGFSHLFGAFLFFVLLPDVKTYQLQAEEVTGIPVKPPASVLKTMSVGCRVMAAHALDHFVFLLMIAIGQAWALTYINLSPQYLVALKGDPDNPDPAIVHRQTRNSMLSFNFMGLFIAPVFAVIGEKVGPLFTPVVMVLVTLFPFLTSGIPSFSVHFIIAGMSCYLALTCPVQINARSFAFASSSKVGTVQGILNSGAAALGLPISLTIQSYMAGLDDPKNEYRGVFTFVMGMSLVAFLVFLAQKIFVGEPPSPVLLREDEEDICVSYGCKYIDEVMFVLEIEDRELLLSQLSSSDPDTQMNLVLHINPERLVSKLMDRDVEEIIVSIEAGIAWRRKTAIADQGFGMGISMGGIGVGGGALAKMLKLDTSKFGQGEAKTLDQFHSEVAKGRSKLIVDEKDPSKMKRLVAIVVLRIYTGSDASSKKLMVQMSEQFPDGRQRMKPQLPGTKRGPNDSLKDCVANTLSKYNMTDLNIQFLYDRTEVTEDTQESPSYPGVFTVYQKEFVDGYIMETNKANLEEVGLPLAVAWSTFHEKSKYTYLCEWLTDKEASDKGIVVSGTPGGQLSRQEEATAPPAKLKTPKEIIRSLEARDCSKKLVFMLQMEDVDELEHWLLTENVRSMREAFFDLENWPDADPEAMNKKFSSLVPEETLTGLMRTRPTLKPLVVDLLKMDLLKVQHENADKKKDLKREE